jgi:hypothetical protein
MDAIEGAGASARGFPTSDPHSANAKVGIAHRRLRRTVERLRRQASTESICQNDHARCTPVDLKGAFALGHPFRYNIEPLEPLAPQRVGTANEVQHATRKGVSSTTFG